MTTVGHGSTTVVLENCWCGIWFGVPEDLSRMHNEQGTGIFCPLGHETFRRKTEAQKLREERERLRARLRHEEDQHEGTRRSLAATKGVLTRTKNRVKKGVCPECHRHFPNLQAHMETKHPEGGS